MTRRSDKAHFALKISLKALDFQAPKDLLNEKTERRVQQMIQHPFTVQIIDEFIIDNKQCMVMELVNRGSLDKVIKTRKEKAEPY